MNQAVMRAALSWRVVMPNFALRLATHSMNRSRNLIISTPAAPNTIA